MDPIITTAIVTALANLSKEAIKDSYGALKAALQNKFGEKKDLVDAVNKLEEQPDSKARKALLEEEVDKAKVNDDPEILKLAQALLDKIKEQPGGQQVITQTISHVKYAATSGSGNASISSITEHDAPQDN